MKFDLNKSTETLKFNLDKRGAGEIKPCQVTVTMDVSGSFDDEHRNGYTQQLLNRLVPFTMLFDKDKTIDMFAFASDATKLDELNMSNYESYIRSNVIGCAGYGRMTNYGKAFKLLLDNDNHGSKVESSPSKGFLGRLFGSKQEVVVDTSSSKDDRYLHFFVTDGHPSDDGGSRILSKLLSENPKAFVVFISVGRSEIKELQQYKKGSQTSYFNLTVDELRNLEHASDDDLFDKIITDQMTKWMS